MPKVSSLSILELHFEPNVTVFGRKQGGQHNSFAAVSTPQPKSFQRRRQLCQKCSNAGIGVQDTLALSRTLFAPVRLRSALSWPLKAGRWSQARKFRFHRGKGIR